MRRRDFLTVLAAVLLIALAGCGELAEAREEAKEAEAAMHEEQCGYFCEPHDGMSHAVPSAWATQYTVCVCNNGVYVPL